MRVDDTLRTLAELGVALAGFSGIVIALGSRARGEWSPLDRRWLSILLSASFGAVLWSLVPLLLLASDLPESWVWLLSSAGWLIHAIAALAVRTRQLTTSRRSDAAAPDRGFLAFAMAGVGAAIVAQSANVLSLHASWPHLAAVMWWLILSFAAFVRLLQGSWA
jgi:hypothetical protein